MLSGIALTALLVLVAVASRAHRPGGGNGAGPQNPPTLVFDYLASMMLVLLPVGAVLVVLSLFMRRGRDLRSGKSNWRRTAAMLAILMSFLAAAVLLADSGRFPFQQRGGNEQPASVGAQSIQRAHKQKGPPAFYRAHFEWIPVLILGSIVLGVGFGAGWIFVRNRLDREAWEQEAALAVALDEVIADTLDDLRAERDPRQAVIRTYARMERTFAAYGVPREQAETPREYVERVLDQLQVSTHSVRRLAQLFSRAKFSVHEIDATMKDDAIEALVGLRAELEHTPEAA